MSTITESEREELQELRDRMERILSHYGSVCESSTEDDPCGPVEYLDAEANPVCAGCYAALCREGEQEIAEAIATLTQHTEAFEDLGAAVVNGQRYAQVLVRVAS